LYFYLTSLGLIGVNSLTLASTNFPTRAGSVAALFGTLQFGVGAFIGIGVGHWHDGTPVPMAAFIAGCGVASLLLVWLALAGKPSARASQGS
jgi:DHA1 family bicyclomycin/chloramphenicol resistance-like MFS transporter